MTCESFILIFKPLFNFAQAVTDVTVYLLFANFLLNPDRSTFLPWDSSCLLQFYGKSAEDLCKRLPF